MIWIRNVLLWRIFRVPYSNMALKCLNFLIYAAFLYLEMTATKEEMMKLNGMPNEDYNLHLSKQPEIQVRRVYDDAWYKHKYLTIFNDAGLVS